MSYRKSTKHGEKPRAGYLRSVDYWDYLMLRAQRNQERRDRLDLFVLSDKNAHEARLLVADHENLWDRELFLERQQSEIETARKKLQIEWTNLEHKKITTDEKMSKLREQGQMEEEKLRKRIAELEKELLGYPRDENLESEAERCRQDYEAMRHVDYKITELESKEKELKSVRDLSLTLVDWEKRTRHELREARDVMINGLLSGFSSNGNGSVGVKRMGELEARPFLNAAKRKHNTDEEVQAKGAELCSLWESRLRDSNWHPFFKDDYNKEMIDEEDEILKRLKSNLGEEVYCAVTKALEELNEYGRCRMTELWNFEEERRASLKEGIEFVLNQCKDYA